MRKIVTEVFACVRDSIGCPDSALSSVEASGHSSSFSASVIVILPPKVKHLCNDLSELVISCIKPGMLYGTDGKWFGCCGQG